MDMKKAAVIVAPGFEEGETLTIVDILRRAHLQCDIFGFDKIVEGGHDIVVQCDKVLNHEVVDYDMVILPGGYGGAAHMRDSDELMGILQQMDKEGKYVCAMCAAPIALERAGLLEHKNFTAYKGYDQKIKAGHYLEDKVVVDGHIVTGRGPATVYAFAYKLVDLLGGDSLAVKKRMVYFNAFDVKEDE
jgi:4-methyl-5(b-hydroxyethyl)-thiazole monophosphate biosynthesis